MEQEQGTNVDFDPTKHCRTLDGRLAKVLFISPVPFSEGETLVVEVEGQALLYFADGRYYIGDTGSDNKLINVPKPRHHAEVAKRYFDEEDLLVETMVSDIAGSRWLKDHSPRWEPAVSYRLVDGNGNVVMTSMAEED